MHFAILVNSGLNSLLLTRCAVMLKTSNQDLKPINVSLFVVMFFDSDFLQTEASALFERKRLQLERITLNKRFDYAYEAFFAPKLERLDRQLDDIFADKAKRNVFRRVPRRP